MASKHDISDVKKILTELRKTMFDLQLRVEDLEDRVEALEGGEVAPSKPKEPEPILTCVQCTAEYRESENAEGCCFYHSGSLVGQGWKYKYSCCGKDSEDYDSAKAIEGCVKGKHRSKHHTDYHYSRYVFYMQEQTKTAKEIWLEMDVEDFITNRCEWAEVGLSDNGNLFILSGSSRVEYTVLATYSSDELSSMEGECVVAFQKSDPVGWNLMAELIVKDKKVSAVRVSIKPASSSVPLVKKIDIVLDENGLPRPYGEVQILSDPTASLKQSQNKQYTIPEQVKEGPILSPGEDFSLNRRTDYETETKGDCPLKLQQHGETEVGSSIVLVDGKWNNLFTCKVKVTNTSEENVSVAEVYGHYMDEDGWWVRCDEVFLGKESFHGNKCEWFDSLNFCVKEDSTETLLVRLCIKFPGPPPRSYYDGRRAHSSLTQPLHLRFTFVDQNSFTASLHFEQGNKPLDLATREKRIKNWCDKQESNLIFWTFADDASQMKRSDATIYYDEKGMICYRPSPNDDACYTYYMSTKLSSIGYQAKSAGLSEFLVEEWKREEGDSSIVLFALVDLQMSKVFGVKIVITTATSKTIDSCLLPSTLIQGTLCVSVSKVFVKAEERVKWQVSRACKNDVIQVFQVNGKSSIIRVNCKGVIEGDASFKAPTVPGEYEARYYPASLQGRYYGFCHDQFIATARFTVVGL